MADGGSLLVSFWFPVPCSVSGLCTQGPQTTGFGAEILWDIAVTLIRGARLIIIIINREATALLHSSRPQTTDLEFSKGDLFG